MRILLGCVFMSSFITGYPVKLPVPLVAHRAQYDPHQHNSVFPYLSPDTFRSYCDHVIDASQRFFDPSLVKKGDTIYLYPYLFYFFFTQIHPKITKQYIIVSSNEDHHIPGPYLSYLNDPKIIAWIGKNAHTNAHPKLVGIPLGFANACWPHGNVSFVSQVAPHIPTQKALLYQGVSKKHLLYMNFVFWTYPTVRAYVYQLFIDKPYCYYATQRTYKDYLQDMAESCFVLSPRGNGVDCHRTWEALAVGAIPIVESSILDHLFEGLPVVIVTDWRVLTQEYLEAQYEKMKHTKYNYERMYASYWFERIDQIKRKGLSR